MVEERRKRTRIPVEFDVKIVFRDQTIKVKTLNISMSGIRFRGSQVFQAGEKCAIHLPLSDAAHLSIEAVILRSNDQETVVSFQSMDEETFYHLKNIIRYNAPDPDQVEKELTKSAFP
ncbi:MAG: PilZ domain-containing protein [Deltaproteobacteria bacterium]|nr:PilZ domain-containing protein [Deltaproteobacteria bacterium]